MIDFSSYPTPRIKFLLNLRPEHVELPPALPFPKKMKLSLLAKTEIAVAKACVREAATRKLYSIS